MITAYRSTVTDNTPTGTYATTPDAKEPPKGPAEPSAPRTALPTNPSGMGRDEFLKMLVAQLKNQDPLNPMDGKDMAAQLAQFSQVEQLIKLNEGFETVTAAQKEVVDAIGQLEETQNARADELAMLIEGQMAMATVGKIGVTNGDATFVDSDGKGMMLIDAGPLKTPMGGRVTITSADGKTTRTVMLDKIEAGQQTIRVEDLNLDPPLTKGKYTFKVDVATESGGWDGVKTYTAGRITGMRYEQGNPVLIIGDELSMPMSQLIQIRG